MLSKLIGYWWNFGVHVFFWRCLQIPSHSKFRFDVFLSFVIVLRIFARNIVVQKKVSMKLIYFFHEPIAKKNMCVLKFAIVIVNVRTKMVRTFLKGLTYAWLVRPCKKVCIFYMHRCIHWQISLPCNLVFPTQNPHVCNLSILFLIKRIFDVFVWKNEKNITLLLRICLSIKYWGRKVNIGYLFVDFVDLSKVLRKLNMLLGMLHLG